MQGEQDLRLHPPPSEGLGISNVDYYWYLNQSGTYTVDGTDDKKDLAETLVRGCTYHQCTCVVYV